MEQIPCIDCLVFPICKHKVILSKPYIGVVGMPHILNINIYNLMRSCSDLQTCLGKTNLFQKKRVKRVDLIKHILNKKKLDNDTIYRLFVDDSYTIWFDQFKGESLDYDKSLYDQNFTSFKIKRKGKKHGNVQTKTR
jgi:hypothetical protein